jgi:hypothetical protein
MFVAEKLFAEYWLATGVVQRLRSLAMKLSGNWQNIVGDAAAPVTVSSKGQVLERPSSRKAKFSKTKLLKGKFLKGQVLERPGCRVQALSSWKPYRRATPATRTGFPRHQKGFIS